jgi:hypothetical protein
MALQWRCRAHCRPAASACCVVHCCDASVYISGSARGRECVNMHVCAYSCLRARMCVWCLCMCIHVWECLRVARTRIVVMHVWTCATVCGGRRCMHAHRCRYEPEGAWYSRVASGTSARPAAAVLHQYCHSATMRSSGHSAALDRCCSSAWR